MILNLAINLTMNFKLEAFIYNKLHIELED